jgi:hypothetical protein
MEAARTLKANARLDGKPCGWCAAGLELGHDAAVCTACDKEYHAGCWDHRGGCATSGCVNTPLRRLDAPAAAMAQPAVVYLAPPPGTMACPRCHVAIAIGAAICPACRGVTSPDGIYHGPRFNAPGAVAAMVWGILGLVLCGIVLGPLAISRANAARKARAADPTLGGAGFATAGTVLGVIDLVLFVVVFFARAIMTDRGMP